MKRRAARIRWVTLYYASWAVFGLVGLVLNLACILLLPMRGTRALERAVRSAIRRLFGAWLAWLHATGVVRVEWRGFGDAPLESGTVYIANHPTLVDATIILARLPDAVSIFKPSFL